MRHIVPTMRRVLTFFAATFLLSATASAADRITKETFVSGGQTRTYYLLVPESAKQAPAPLVVLLHGSGRNGRSLLEKWEAIAKQEGIALVGPDASSSQSWRIPRRRA
jgi:poly(3-hydroxybutyrate) depolymerase